jgi:hypothetical protein
MKNKKSSLFIFIAVLTCSMQIMAQSVDWAYSFKHTAVQENIIDVSSNGTNTFAIIGKGNAGICMDPINNNPSYNSPGDFVAAYNDQAQIKWIYQTPGTTTWSTKVAANGDVYISGNFDGTFDFDPTSGVYNMTSNGFDVFLVKINANGTFGWAARSYAEGAQTLIEIMPDSRIIVAGRANISSTDTLSNGTPVNISKGVFIAEFSAGGLLTNSHSISLPSPGFVNLLDIHADNNNNIYLAGSFEGIADFDLGSGVANNAMTNAYDAFVVKYNSSFQLEWFKVFGDNNTAPKGWDWAHGIATDGNGNIYACGEFTWTTDFDPSNPGQFVLQSDNDTQEPSGFIVKWNANGAIQWVKKIGNTNDIPANRAHVRITDIIFNNNKLYTAMAGFGKWDLDPSSTNVYFEVGNASAVGIGYARYSINGDFESGFTIDSNYVSGYGVHQFGFGMLGNDKIVTAGDFNKKIDFDPSSGVLYLATDINGMFYDFDKDLFIARYTFGNYSGINEANNHSNIKVYPNPANHQLTLQTLRGGIFELIDISGRVLNIYNINNTIETIPINLPSGLYFIREKESGVTQKLMIE